MQTRAQWVEDIPDLYNDLAAAATYLTVAQVAAQTGLSVSTITDLLSRPRITSTVNPQGPISRPAARIGNRPLYSHKQVNETNHLLENAAKRRHFGGGDERLPTISYAEATERGLLSTEEIAALATAENPDGVHEQTVRRWSRDFDDFPKRVANRARKAGHPGVPMVVYDGAKARQWLVKHGHRAPEPDVAASA